MFVFPFSFSFRAHQKQIPGREMNEPKRRGSCISNPEDKTKIQTEDQKKQNKPQTPSLLPNTEQEQD